MSRGSDPHWKRRFAVCMMTALALLAASCGEDATEAPDELEAAAADEAAVNADPDVTSGGEGTAPAAGGAPGPETSGTPTAAPAPTATPPAVPARVVTGAAALVEDDLRPLHGRRVGLIAHQASVVGGERLADVIDRHPQVELAALFAPEHGLFGTGAAGETIGDATDPATGAPVFSLYGDTRAPTAASLAGLDVLVYDLQDVGTRFYTYTSTLGLAMQAAARADIGFVVLDRPNPLGGSRLQGPILQAGLESFIGLYPVPSAYGLTAGELARLIVSERLLPDLEALRLEVVPVQGWFRPTVWADTGLEWIAPSPNLPTADAAMVYPGTVLFEATGISEGRGTDRPFQLIGAPWLDGEALAAELNGRGLPGVRFEAASFTPRSIPGAAPSPRFEGERLAGVDIVVTDPAQVAGLDVGLHLLDAVLRQGEARGLTADQVIDRPDVFDRLAGTPAVRQALVRGDPVATILASFEADHLAFWARSAAFILYP